MKVISTFWLIISIVLPFTLPGQYTIQFTVVQPHLLEADAGGNHVVAVGTVVQLGGTPAAIGGTPPYNYQWSPAYGLTDTTIPNPSLTADSNLIYTLRVTDTEGCSAESTVEVSIVVDVNMPGKERRSVVVAPNPVTDGVVNITGLPDDGREYEVLISNVTGQIIYRKTHKEQSLSIDLGQHSGSGGIFILSVVSGSTSHHKIIMP